MKKFFSYSKFFVLFSLPFISINHVSSVEQIKDNINIKKPTKKKLKNRVEEKVYITKSLQLSKENITNKVLEEHLKSEKLFLIDQLLSSILNNPRAESNFEDSTNFLKIDSDLQYQKNEILYAEGNASIKYLNKELLADKIIFDRNKKIFKVEGNVKFLEGGQFLIADSISFDINLSTGIINNVYGIMDISSLAKDLSLKDRSDDKSDNNEELKNRKIDNVRFENQGNLSIKNRLSLQALTLSRLASNKWRFKTDQIIMEPDKWTAKQIFFTNDPFNTPQLIIEGKNVRGEILNDKVKFVSRSSFLHLDDKVKIPLGRREIYDGDDFFNNVWGIGYDDNDKDGLFIFRNFKTIQLGENSYLDLKPHFLLQRFINSETKAFSEKDSSILDTKKIVTKTKFFDYFALNSDFYGNISNWSYSLSSFLRSLDLQKIDRTSSFKIDFKRSFYFNQKIDSSNKEARDFSRKALDLKFFGSYQEQVDKGFSGLSKIYNAKGVNLAFENKWIDTNNKKYGINLSNNFGEYNAKSKSSNKLISSFRNVIGINFFYEIPILDIYEKDLEINEEFKYTPQIIDQGINFKFDVNAALFSYLVDDSEQQALIFKFGPEIVFGELKKKVFDYTSFEIKNELVTKSGESPFEFDSVDDSNRMNLNIKQQLYGPIIFTFDTYINLNSYSEDYGKLSNQKYTIDFNRRAYSFGLFYDVSEESAGFSFNIFNFDFSGRKPRF